MGNPGHKLRRKRSAFGLTRILGAYGCALWEPPFAHSMGTLTVTIQPCNESMQPSPWKFALNSRSMTSNHYQGRRRGRRDLGSFLCLTRLLSISKLRPDLGNEFSVGDSFSLLLIPDRMEEFRKFKSIPDYYFEERGARKVIAPQT